MNFMLQEVVCTKLKNRVEHRLKGKLHREDGPAIEFSNGFKQWYLNGKRLTEEEFLKAVEAE